MIPRRISEFGKGLVRFDSKKNQGSPRTLVFHPPYRPLNVLMVRPSLAEMASVQTATYILLSTLSWVYFGCQEQGGK